MASRLTQSKRAPKVTFAGKYKVSQQEVWDSLPRRSRTVDSTGTSITGPVCFMCFEWKASELHSVW